MSRLGFVQEKFRNDTEVRFEWRIKKIFSMLEHAKGDYSSYRVFFLGTKWYLKIYPNDVEDSCEEDDEDSCEEDDEDSDKDSSEEDDEDSTEKWIELEIQKSGAKASALFTVGIKKADGTEEDIVRDQKLSEYQHSFREKNFLLMSELLSRRSELAPSDVLTITCKIWTDEPPPVEIPVGNALFSGIEASSLTATSSGKDDCINLESTVKMMISRETQTENVSDIGSRAAELHDQDIKGLYTLREHLKDLLRDGDDHDVTFAVKGQAFKAHRNMLRARSPVFAAMFKHVMKESTDDPIDIVDCSPEAFGQFLQYIYTGKVENFSPSTALGVYYAGDKYNVSGLKEACVQFLETSLSTTAVCDIIALAAKYGEEELLERATAFFTENLEEIMSTKEWQRFLADNLLYANEMCLKAVKTRLANKN